MAEKLPAPPSHLSRRMKSYWRAVVRDFRFAPHQLEILRRACEAGDRADEARQLLKKEGLTVMDRYDQVRPHPAATIERDSRIAQARLIRELALSPEPEDERPPRTGTAATGRAR